MQQNTQNAMLQQQIQDCIRDCLNCHQVCQSTATSMQPQSQNITHQTLMLDCAELCQTTAHFMQHNSPVAGYVTQACIQVCTHCKEVCRQAGMDDCANACDICANSCQQMVKMVVM